jgi:hypothetical protein
MTKKGRARRPFLGRPFLGLTALGVVALAGGASASLTSHPPVTAKQLHDLAERIDRTDSHSSLNCPPLDPSHPTQVFLFEGAEGYCPRFALARILGGVPTEFWKTDTSDAPKEIQSAKDRIDSLVKRDTGNCNLIRSVESEVESLGSERLSRVQFHYYAKGENRAAIACARHLSDEARDLGVSIGFRGIGYSMGGYTVLEFSKGLRNGNVPIEKILTIDPVGRHLKWVNGVLFSRDTKSFKVPSNVASWRNFFQKLDTHSLKSGKTVHFGARGSRVFGADQNTQVDPSRLNDLYQHVYILDLPEVIDAVDDILQP